MPISTAEEGFAYNNLEEQYMKEVVAVDGGDDDDAGQSSTISYDVTERGLDRGEIAEVVAIHTTASMNLQESEVATQTEPGSVHISNSFGTNPDGDGSVGLTPAEISLESVSNVEFGFNSATQDELGILDQVEIGYNMPFSDATNGFGGGGMVPTVDHLLNLKEMFGRGPMVDRFDDFFSHYLVTVRSISDKQEMNLKRRVWYQIHDREVVDPIGFS